MKKHLHNSLRALFLSLAVLLSLPMLAVEVEIDGINYELITKTKEATVIKKSSGEYSGDIIIPETVEYNDIIYNVICVERMGGWYNEYNYGLTSVTIPNSVTSIGSVAFMNCRSLKSVTIGNGVKSIGTEAFHYSDRLTAVYISDIEAWCNIKFEGGAGNPLSSAHHLYLNGEEVKDLIIPDGLESINDYIFYGCSGLTSVTIPNSVTNLGRSAFSGCSGLTSVTIPNSVTSIGDGAFCLLVFRSPKQPKLFRNNQI
ncbi:MAG: leucine-rich repeat domain-containing protein [Bacteroidaceae bacterium]|nr:leucine-rich repeat domain-containing protein [Bacteroidaceae bacterium]